jgi:GNAT superfamily N-acetyltransferase
MTYIAPLRDTDRRAWQPLWDAYLEFYEAELSPEITDDVFARLVAGRDLHGAIAWGDKGEPLGLVHWLFHPSTWSASDYCYLEDLFVSPDARGLGIGRALIEHVDEAARQLGATKVYWLTHESNTTAQALYDRVSDKTGFIHYERPL